MLQIRSRSLFHSSQVKILKRIGARGYSFVQPPSISSSPVGSTFELSDINQKTGKIEVVTDLGGFDPSGNVVLGTNAVDTVGNAVDAVGNGCNQK